MAWKWLESLSTPIYRRPKPAPAPPPELPKYGPLDAPQPLNPDAGRETLYEREGREFSEQERLFHERLREARRKRSWSEIDTMLNEMR